MPNDSGFDLLFDLLQRIKDDEVATASGVMQRYSANVSLRSYPDHLVSVVEHLSTEARDWFSWC